MASSTEPSSQSEDFNRREHSVAERNTRQYQQFSPAAGAFIVPAANNPSNAVSASGGGGPGPSTAAARQILSSMNERPRSMATGRMPFLMSPGGLGAIALPATSLAPHRSRSVADHAGNQRGGRDHRHASNQGQNRRSVASAPVVLDEDGQRMGFVIRRPAAVHPLARLPVPEEEDREGEDAIAQLGRDSEDLPPYRAPVAEQEVQVDIAEHPAPPGYLFELATGQVPLQKFDAKYIIEDKLVAILNTKFGGGNAQFIKKKELEDESRGRRVMSRVTSHHYVYEIFVNPALANVMALSEDEIAGCRKRVFNSFARVIREFSGRKIIWM